MFLDGYAVSELVAQSERNSVRRARRLRDGARVIIKTSTTEYPTARDVRRLEFEQHVLAKLRTKSVVELLGVERRSGRFALILEDFGGEPLPVARGQGLALERFFPLAAGLVRALGEVHAAGVIHKDINPRNVLMNPATGMLKIIDFSLASELAREHADAQPCRDLEGTLAYLSPEQTGRMNRDLDYRTDYYSLGVTFYELLTGALPFSAPDVLGYVHCHLSKQPPSASDTNASVPEALARIVAKLLAKNPDERYQSASGLLRDLARSEESWRNGGVAPAFPLGEHDVSERFQVSRALVGREAEVARLLSAFEAASSGPARLLLVSGYSGVGKSSLVRELYRAIVERRGNFVAGKFEQLERNTPYGAVVQALKSLLRPMLTASEEQLLAQRRRFETALGSEANVLIPLLPELGRIMGSQPSVAELPAREAQARLMRVFRAFFGAVATRAEPLVVFLDDLQWTDGSTPQLLVQLLAEGNLQHVLVLGAYRDNEVGESHLLRAALSELERKRPAALDEVRVAPLDESALERIVASTLHVDVPRARPLAHLLFQRTGGNPFFTSELLYRLHRQNAIQFDAVAGAFAYDPEAMANLSFSDNVVDLMVERLQELPEATLDLLRLAACFGNEFGLARIARIAEQSRHAVAGLLFPAVERGLLAPKGDAYRLLRPEHEASSEVGATVHYEFPHDRVLQAAYSLLPVDERARVHMEIGRLLRDETPPDEQAERVFEFVDHLNLGRALLTASSERAELSQHNQWAARRARRSAAYSTAVLYLETSESLLSEVEWQAFGLRRFELLRMRVECLFLSGQVERASALCEELFARAPNRVATASVYCLKAQIQEQQSRLAESVATIVGGLRELGLDLPESPELVEKGIGEGIGKLLGHLERVPIEELERLPVLADPEGVAVTELLFQLIPPASQMNPPLFILAELMLFDHALSNGTVAGSAKNFMDCGIVLGAILKDYPRAYRMGKVAFAMLERQIPTPLESAVNFVFGCFISHFGAHFSEGLDALARGHRRGIELGDTLHASYSIVHHAKSSLFAGKELSACRSSTELARAYTRATGAVGHEAVPRMLERALGRLQATNLDQPDLALSDAEFTREIEKTGNDHFLFVTAQIDTLVHMVFGDWGAAELANRAVEARIAVGNGSFPVPDYYLFGALILCKKARSGPADEREDLLSRAEQHARVLATFAEVCPANFAHKHRLALAELARAKGAPIDEVLLHYGEALAAAGDDFLHLRALCYELEAEFWNERAQPQLARECLLEAYHLYRHWGARAKLAHLERAHPGVLERANGSRSASRAVPIDTLVTATVTTGAEGSSLDVASAIKASHAISGEIKAERLFAVLVQTIIENVGAECGYLIVGAEGSSELCVAARAQVSEASYAEELPIALERFEPVAHELVRYVARTHETIVLDDAGADELYRNDPHVVSKHVQSVLCMPIVNRGELQAILYVENNAVSAAFTPARLSVLRIIAGQAAISIANAHLYNHLEQKVAERTRELAERNREIGAMLNSLEQGVFTIDERLAIEPRYSAHLEQVLGARQLAGRDCLDVLFTGTGLDRQALDDMRAALEFSFGVAAVFAEANRSHWVREFQRPVSPEDGPRSFEVDWTLIPDGDDCVCKILVAVRDVTLVKQLSRKAAEHARDLDIVGQVLDATVEQFRRLAASARRALADGRSLLEREPDSAEALAEVFRQLHTLKGNARMLGFGYLARAVHAAEEPFDERYADRDPEARRRQMLNGIDGVLASVAEYERVCTQKLGDVLEQGKREADDVTHAVEFQIEQVKAGYLDAKAAVAAIERVLERKKTRVPLAAVVKSAARVLPALADEQRKVAPRVELDDPGVELPSEVASALGDALVHVFTNALDHGLEPASERLERGKPARGCIQVGVLCTATGTRVSVSDDGRGLALEALRRGTAGPLLDELAAERIFSPGVSTAERVTTSSGRGVGLDAVRSALRRLGGDARVALGAPAAGGYRSFELVLELPAAEPAAPRVPTARASELPPRPSRPPAGRRDSVPPRAS